jgi:hypothetical protein
VARGRVQPAGVTGSAARASRWRRWWWMALDWE